MGNLEKTRNFRRCNETGILRGASCLYLGSLQDSGPLARRVGMSFLNPMGGGSVFPPPQRWCVFPPPQRWCVFPPPKRWCVWHFSTSLLFERYSSPRRRGGVSFNSPCFQLIAFLALQQSYEDMYAKDRDNIITNTTQTTTQHKRQHHN